MDHIEGYTLEKDHMHPHMFYLYQHYTGGMRLQAVIYNDYDLALKWCEELNAELAEESK